MPDTFSMREAGQITNLLTDIRIELVKLPKQFPRQSVSVDVEGIIESIEALHNEMKSFPKDSPVIEFPDAISVNNFPPFPVSSPVTHISINSLRGFVKTTAATVTTTLTTLPSYGVLDNRRSILVYNNSSNTIYIGGSDVTSTNGMPVPASSYSPILDCGISMILYGIATAGSNDIRVLEVSDENSGR